MAVTNKKLFGKHGFDANNASISNVADPTNAQDVATKAYSTNATNLASGTVAVARLGSGTADNSSFLRGDGTWQTITTGVSSITGTANEITASSSTGAITLSLPSSLTATNLTLTGNLTVEGTTTTIDTTNLAIKDKQIELAKGSTTNAGAEDGGLLLKALADKKFTWLTTPDAWTSSVNLNVASGKTYKVDGTDVLSGSTLGSGITTSSLTTVGTITSGTWNGSVIGSSYGGAGTVSGVLKANGSGTVSAAVSGTDYLVPAGTYYIGTTSNAFNRGSAAQTLNGVGIDGNAATATALANARAINGVDFDGTAAITVTAAAGTLSGNTLASGVTASSLTSVGTLGSLTVTNAITGSVTGNAGTVTNGVYTTDTGTVTSTMILDGTILNADINASAAIADTKLATISTASKVSNSATTATSANTASAIVARDGSGNFTAGTITAALTGLASTATDATNATNVAITNDTSTSSYVYPVWVGATSGNQAVKTTDIGLKFKPSTGELVTVEETKVSKSIAVNNSAGGATTIDTFTGGAAEYLIAVYQLTASGGAEARAVVKLLMSVTGKPTAHDLNYIEMGESQSLITLSASVNATTGLTTLTAIGVNGAGYSYNVVFTRTSLSLETA